MEGIVLVHQYKDGKRIVIISNTFYPDPSVGAVRMTQWSRLLAEFGWVPTILCQQRGFNATREVLSEGVHPAVEVYYFSSLEESRQSSKATNSSLRSSIRRGVPSSLKGALKAAFVPDVTVGDWRGVREEARYIVRQIEPQLLLSSSPSHAVHDLGMWLAEQTGLPWVADFRDPYLLDVRFAPQGMGKLYWTRHQAFEEEIYRRAMLITHAVPVHARWARKVYPWARSRIATITNGVPEELVAMVEGRDTASTEGAGTKRVCVVGRRVEAREAMMLSEAVKRIGGYEGTVQLRLIGAKPRNESDLANHHWVTMQGEVPHIEALGEIAEADVLVAMLSARRSEVMGLSSKLFEYLATGRPIVVVNPTRPDSSFLRTYKGVWELGRGTNKPATADTLAQALTQALQLNPLQLRKQGRGVREKYNRRLQVKSLVRHLEECCSEATS